jgi:hypothetical protein
LIELLHEERYQSEAARGLLQLAVPPFFGNTTNFEAIWAARAGAQLPFDAPRAKRYAKALRQRISELKQESVDAGNQQYFAGRIKDLAALLAAHDGRDSAEFVIAALTPPGQWDAYARMKGAGRF